MDSFSEYIDVYRKQLEKGDIVIAYKGLMGYFKDLRLHLKNTYPDYFVSSSVTYGWMDYTYFYFFPKSLKNRKLKIMILFIHDTFSFEIWLAGYNKKVQKECLNLFSKSNWNTYHIASTTVDVYSIVDHVLTNNPDFSDLDRLTKKLEGEILTFIKDIEEFLSQH